MVFLFSFFFFSSRRRHTRFKCDWSSDVCSSDLFPGRQLQRDESASNLRFSGRKIGDAEIRNSLVVAGAAPHESAIQSARSDLLLPKNRAFTVGIQSVHHAGLVTCDQDAFSAAERSKNSRIAEVRIDEWIFRAIRLVLADAGEVVA